MQTAVRLMYAGAAISLVELVVSLATIGGLRKAIKKADPKYTSSQLHTAEIATIAFVIVVAVVAIGLWLWMARAAGSGHNYARITGTVLFGIYTLLLLGALRRPGAGVAVIFDALEWLVGLGAVIMLWRRDSSAYLKPGNPQAP